MPPVLEASQISRVYGSFQALQPTDVQLQPGDLITLVGPNGSGKSTLLSCLSGLLRPSSGAIRIAGYDLYRQERPARQRLAYVPDVPVYYQELTAWEHLRFTALAHHAEQGFDDRAQRLLEAFGLWEARDLFPHAYSRGMRLKLGIVLALIRPFSVLLLDEPSSALDTAGVALLAEHLRREAQRGAAVLLSTHDQQFAAQLGARVWTMQEGRLAAG